VLEPVLQAHPVAPAARAWRLQPQVVVALLGGNLAFGPVALVNAHRLALPRRRYLLVAAIVAAGLLGAVLLALPSQDGRIVGFLVWDRPCAIAAALATRALQSRYDRAYHFYRAGVESYARLLPVGAVAVAVAVAVQIALGVAA
jgi:hypothetical protein